MLAVAASCVVVGVAFISDTREIALAGIYSVVIAAGATALATQRARRGANGALQEERQRIARNLHDGLAQELAYIRMEAMHMAAMQPRGRAERVAAAAQRALEESRDAIDALRSGGDDPFSVEFADLADELTTREGATVSVQVDPNIEVDEKNREALLRIMREAVCNGLRHGHATEVALELTGGDGIRMAVRDNGAGFVPGGPRRRGSFGLTSMRERAGAVGGNLTVESAPGAGTLVEVRLP